MSGEKTFRVIYRRPALNPFQGSILVSKLLKAVHIRGALELADEEAQANGWTLLRVEEVEGVAVGEEEAR